MADYKVMEPEVAEANVQQLEKNMEQLAAVVATVKSTQSTIESLGATADLNTVAAPVLQTVTDGLDKILAAWDGWKETLHEMIKFTNEQQENLAEASAKAASRISGLMGN